MTALRVLYLEDNPDHVLLVTDALQIQFPGCQVESASLLPEALTCLSSRHYDTVLVSSHLHGESTIPRLHNIVSLLHGTPIIVIAGNGDEKNAANAIKHGATDYLLKSRESLDVLPYLIQRLLKKKRPSGDHKPVEFVPSGIDHLMGEIDQVSRRIHSLQDSPTTDPAILGLQEELRQLKQFAMQLSETSKTGKTKT
jgi:DNA-binding NtrC family response regulator